MSDLPLHYIGDNNDDDGWVNIGEDTSEKRIFAIKEVIDGTQNSKITKEIAIELENMMNVFENIRNLAWSWTPNERVANEA